jgi:acetyl-CoA carboxylase alpha subunit
MVKAIQTGVLDLDDSEKEKSLKKMRAISFSYLEKTRSEYNTAVGSIRSLKQRKKSLSISREVERMQKEADNINSRIGSNEKIIDKLASEIEDERLKFIESSNNLAKKLSDFIGGRAELV